MQSIIFNFTGSSVCQTEEALAVKAGFLLGDDVDTAGTLCLDMFYTQNVRDASLKKRMAHMENLCSHNTDFLEELQMMKADLKACDNIKHKSRELLVARKKVEQAITENWTAVMDAYETIMKKRGLVQLRELTKSGEIGCYFMNLEPENPSARAMTASQLLQRLLVTDEEEDGEPELFFLTSEFFSDNYIKPSLYNYEQKEAAELQNICLHACITLPDINGLSTDELRIIREELSEAGSAFRKKMDEWIDMCYEEDEAEARSDFFRNHVVTSANELQAEINNNNLLRMIYPGKTDRRQKIYIGEIPVWSLWDFYNDFDVLKEETRAKLQQLKAQGIYQNARWPVMVSHTHCEQKTDTPAGDQDIEIQPVKKYISID